jgi:hypothetical protein
MASAARTGFIGWKRVNKVYRLGVRPHSAGKISSIGPSEAVTGSSTSGRWYSVLVYAIRLDQLCSDVQCPFDETKAIPTVRVPPIFRRNETWIKQILWEQNEQRHVAVSGVRAPFRNGALIV